MLIRVSYALFILLFLSARSLVAEPEIFVNHSEGEYTLQMNLLVTGDTGTVLRLLTDFNHLDKLSPAIQSSKLLETGPQGSSLVQTVVSDCVLFFCKTMQRVEQVLISDSGRITAHVIPEQSDFSRGESEWVISRLEDQVSIRYQARLVPKFSVPPGIGPLMIKHVMRRELRQIAAVIQRAE